MAKECALSTGKLPPRGLPRNRGVRIIDCPDMTSAVYCGHNATNETNKSDDLSVWVSTLSDQRLSCFPLCRQRDLKRLKENINCTSTMDKVWGDVYCCHKAKHHLQQYRSSMKISKLRFNLSFYCIQSYELYLL